MPTVSNDQYVLMPSQGLRAEDTHQAAFLQSLSNAPQVGAAGAGAAFMRELDIQPQTPVRVLDSIAGNSAKLVQMSPQAILALRAQQPGIRVVPVVYYDLALAPRHHVSGASLQAMGIRITVQVVNKATNAPAPGAAVVAFTNFAASAGDEQVSDAQGKVQLSLGQSHVHIDRLYVYPKDSFWPALQQNLTLTTGQRIALTPIDLNMPDVLRFFYGNLSGNVGNGAGVRVGVIDSGVDPTRADLKVEGGMNLVTGEDPADFAPGVEEHGTHVAGIIAAHGTPPAGIRGVAPQAIIRSYRVFPKTGGKASSFAIAKAIDQAVHDGCDLINMSLGGGSPDPLTSQAIAHARNAGVLVIIAAGNNNRGAVTFPGSDPLALAISAVGRQGTYPAGASQFGDIANPAGADPLNYIASFSNVGPQIALTGPGDGIISTVLNQAFGVLDGTSMACPAVTGVAAHLLSGTPQVLGMSRNQQRSDAMAQLLLQSAKSLGFPSDLEGHGMPGLNVVNAHP